MLRRGHLTLLLLSPVIRSKPSPPPAADIGVVVVSIVVVAVVVVDAVAQISRTA
jgi:hypothetical protein